MPGAALRPSRGTNPDWRGLPASIRPASGLLELSPTARVPQEREAAVGHSVLWELKRRGRRYKYIKLETEDNIPRRLRMAGGTPCRGVEQHTGGGGAAQGGPERTAIAVCWRPLRFLRPPPRPESRAALPSPVGLLSLCCSPGESIWRSSGAFE